MRTQVAIIGAGPAGLLLSHLLHLNGIESVVLESRSRAEIEATIRAGVLEQGSMDILNEAGVGERMRKEGALHHGFELAFGGRRHRIDLRALTGKAITVYPQHEVIIDLVAARIAAGGTLLFEPARWRRWDRWRAADGELRARRRGARIEADFVIGCDGFHGVSRPLMAQQAPRQDFSGLSLRLVRHPGRVGAVVGRTDLRPPRARLRPGQHPLADGAAPVLPVRSARPRRQLVGRPHLVRAACAPGERRRLEAQGRQYLPEEHHRHAQLRLCADASGRLFLAGDAAHIVPPTGAKGMNLAISDVKLLARALEQFYRRGSEEGLDRYTDDALKRVWRAEFFSWWMTRLLHTFEAAPFDREVQLAELENIVPRAPWQHGAGRELRRRVLRRRT
jgi:p-hydroxybenzoate 3-monooxygenase